MMKNNAFCEKETLQINNSLNFTAILLPSLKMEIKSSLILLIHKYHL